MTQLCEKKLLPWWHHYQWQLMFVMLLGSIVNYVDRVNISFATIDISHELGLSVSQMGFILAAWMWPYALANLPSGWLIDKFDISKVFVGSLVLWSMATISSGLAMNYHELYLSRLFLGIAEAPFFVIGGKIVQLYFKEYKRGLAASIFNTGPKIANGFAPPLIAFLIVYASWRGMFIFLGLLGFLLVGLWMKVYKKEDSVYLVDKSSVHLIPKTRFSIWRLLNRPTSWWLNLGNFGSSYVFWLYFTWLPTYLMEKGGLDLKTAGWVSALPFIAGMIAVPLGGYLSDLLIRRYHFNVIKARLIPAITGCLISGLTVIPINFIDNLTIVVTLFTISTFAVSARAGVVWALVGDISPKNAVGILGGVQNCANFIGGALAPTVTGIVLQQTGNYTIVFEIGGVLIIFAAFCYSMINKPIEILDIAKSIK